MGWLDCHLHEFRIKDVKGQMLMLSFGIPDEEFGDEILPGWKHKTLADPKHEGYQDMKAWVESMKECPFYPKLSLCKLAS